MSNLVILEYTLARGKKAIINLLRFDEYLFNYYISQSDIELASQFFPQSFPITVNIFETNGVGRSSFFSSDANKIILIFKTYTLQ